MTCTSSLPFPYGSVLALFSDPAVISTSTKVNYESETMPEI